MATIQTHAEPKRSVWGVGIAHHAVAFARSGLASSGMIAVVASAGRLSADMETVSADFIAVVADFAALVADITTMHADFAARSASGRAKIADRRAVLGISGLKLGRP